MTTKLASRRAAFLTLGLAALLALALGLWAFQRQEAEATPPLEDLTVTVASAPPESSPLAAGGSVSYTVTVSADGATTTASVPLDIYLSGVTLVAGSVVPDTGITCIEGTPIDCTVTTVFAGTGSRSVDFQATVNAGPGPAQVGAVLDTPINGTDDGVLTEEGNDANAVEDPPDANTDGDDGDDPDVNCAGVQEGTDGAPTEEPDNFDCTSHTVATGFDLTLTKTAAPAESQTLPTGTLVSYTLTVSNTGSGTATSVPIRDTLGTGLTFFGVTPGTGVSNCTGTTTINCTAASIPPGESRTVIVSATVSATSGSVLNGAAVDPENVIGETNDDADDPDLQCSTVGEGTDLGGATEADNFDCTSHAVGGQLDLTLTKSASPSDGSSVATGSTITYTLTAANSGGGAAANVVIRDEPGSGLTFVSMTAASGTAGTGVTCTDTTGPEYDCTASSIPAGESRSVTVVATVSASSGTVLNGGYVDPGSAIPEDNEDADDPSLDCAAVGEGADGGNATEPDNFDCTSHAVGVAGLNLSVTKTASPSDGSSVATGGAITYTITVSASGTAASNVAIRDTIGTGLSLTSVTPGTGVTCSDTTAPEINCTAASIAAGSSVTVTVATTVSATSGTVLNGARVDPAGAITETNEDADDPSLDCSTVGEGTDAGDATEPDNFDCTSHTVGAAAGTRTLNLSPAGWHNFVWTGASATAPETALACISGKFQIAYEHTSLGVFQRFVPGHPELSNMSPLTQYDPLFVFITAEGVTCVMPVVS